MAAELQQLEAKPFIVSPYRNDNNDAINIVKRA
jgi:hypothetical protein